MDGGQLRKILSRDQCLKVNFRGIFARDRVPRCLLPGFYIWNTGLFASAGEHWVAIYVTEDHNVEFFDSFGKSPKFYGWDISQSINYNKKPLQSLDSDVCGMYCLFFLYFRCRGLNMDAILANFGSNRRENDNFVKQFMQIFK